MLDPKLLRNHLGEVSENLKKRNYELDASVFSQLEEKRKELQQLTQSLQNERNVSSKAIGKAKSLGEDIQPLLDQVATLGDQLKLNEKELLVVQDDIDQIMSGIPNLP